MIFLRQAQKSVWSPTKQQALYHWLIHVLAAVTFATIMAFSVLLWPIPHLGFTVVDPSTAMIVSVEPESSAARVGLQPGDRIIQIYDRPWNEVIAHPNVLTLIGARERPVPILIERAHAVYRLSLVQDPPSIAFQIAKGTSIVLALLCWLTGYMLGIVRRQESSGSPLVAAFWLSLGGVLGAYFFARYASYPLRLLLDWLILAVLTPFAVYIHLWFPVRPVPYQLISKARRVLLVSLLLLNGGLVAYLLVWQPPLIPFVTFMSDLVLIGLLFGFVASGILLYRAYQQASVEHVRRQIRLIAMACFFVAATWLFLLVLPSFLLDKPLLAHHWIDLLAGAIPLAYLIGGVAPDLHRVDRVICRLAIHLSTIAVLAGVCTAIITTFGYYSTTAALWIAVCFVVCYGPVQRLGLRLLPAWANPTYNTYHALHAATTKLTSTLDMPTLVDVVCSGVSDTFGQPALAWYVGDLTGSNDLTCVTRQRFPLLPEQITAGIFTNLLQRLPVVTETRVLHTMLISHPLTSVEERVVHAPGVVLCCPVRHSQGYLLGLLLLGMRGDLDPYRAQDIHELQRLLEAAALALANSAAYTQQCEAEATIRHLYQRLQQAQDATAAAIAREIHDEIINVNVRLNIEALQKLLGQIHDPAIRDELVLLLESERTEAQALRLLCEQLHPTGIDDPLGLAGLLRMQVERTQAIWSGECRLVVTDAPHPIEPSTQREVIRITQEALINAVKHASATQITVYLDYPNTPGEPVRLTIRDNGCTGQPISLRAGHWGVRNMYERARTIGGELQFRCEPEGGTAVMLAFAPQIEPV